MPTLSAPDAAFFARLRVQDAAFSAGLPAMLDELATLQDPPALQHQLNTLAGCATTFGYRRLGREARTLEQRLRVLCAFDAVPAIDWADWFSQLAALVAWARLDPRAGAAL
ncbi:Hpt domain-containing protein [Massilia sp. S19_KUP03_FR1]|uniref:Hpt domain-containing protein n=1 Tax=Massilia sp. S19_KUP03_FR1 TaxID=3025503 RepID=UPI002FCDBBF2